MEPFPFDLLLNYKMENCSIKPPANFSLLSEVIAEKFDLKISNIFYVNESGQETLIKDDNDYAQLLCDTCDNGVTEIEIVIKSNEDMSQKRKRSLRKRSTLKDTTEFSIIPKAMNGTYNSNDADEDDDEGGVEYGNVCDYDYYGDTRNRKAMADEGWTNKCTNKKNLRRIDYIKEKKEMRRMEQLEREQQDKDNDDIDEVYEEERRNKGKRKLKCNNKDNTNDDMSVDDDNDNGKKKKGKKKKGKH
jgi:hypothetical protein